MAGTYIMGTFRRTKGQRRLYSYTAVFDVIGSMVTWDAIVRHEEEIKGKPYGRIATIGAVSPEGVKRLIEQSIEDLIGVDE